MPCGNQKMDSDLALTKNVCCESDSDGQTRRKDLAKGAPLQKLMGVSNAFPAEFCLPKILIYHNKKRFSSISTVLTTWVDFVYGNLSNHHHLIEGQREDCWSRGSPCQEHDTNVFLSQSLWPSHSSDYETLFSPQTRLINIKYKLLGKQVNRPLPFNQIGR